MAALRNGVNTVIIPADNEPDLKEIDQTVRRKNLAYVGATPGKTSRINYFRTDGRLYLVDLPGYGYARVSREEKARWAKLMESYFQDEGRLITLGILIVDARHKPSADDVTMHRWFVESGCPEVVAANKVDKLKPSETEAALDLIRRTLELDAVPLIPFSAEKGTGREELARCILERCGR
jgi:GTP-binding protein